MADLLLELLSEEIPARMQEKAALDLIRLVADGLASADLAAPSMHSFVTPRRLTLVADGLPLATRDISEERRGPRVGAPAAALDGFLKSAAVTLDQCEQRDTGKGVFYFAMIRRPGRQTAAVLRTVLETVLATFPWPKSMRWGAHAIRWVRPLQSILCLFDGRVIPVTFGPLTAADQTVGHRFLAPRHFAVRDFADYAQKLANAKVMLDPKVRRQSILDQAVAAAAREGLGLRPDDSLLDEVCGLVEWPRVLTGTIESSFLSIPDEVLITSMRAHQKYLSLLRPDGRLANRFLIVANMDPADGGAAIIAGNERVLRARLSDASFFWETDRKVRLETRLPKLVERIFYQGLGTVADKAARLEALASSIALAIGAEPALAARAARLAKADLSSSMVAEFPELQGIMGRYYALHDGEPPTVAQAIADHYAPQGPADRCPTSSVSVAVALADKIDTLVGFFALGEKPSGSKDPFALRRAALGVIRLIVENGVRLSLREVIRRAYSLYRLPLPHAANEATADLLAFFADRIKVHLRERGVRHDLVTAMFALGEEDDLVRLVARVGSLQAFLASDDGANLLIAFRRAANIVRIEEKKDGVTYDSASPPAASSSETEWEVDLAQTLARADGDLHNALAREDFVAAMGHMAALRGPVDRFFDKVTVNSDEAEARVRRLRLLAGVRRVMNLVADFSCVEA